MRGSAPTAVATGRWRHSVLHDPRPRSTSALRRARPSPRFRGRGGVLRGRAAQQDEARLRLRASGRAARPLAVSVRLMGKRNRDRYTIDDGREACPTVGSMRRARWLVLAVCPVCDLQIEADLKVIETIKGE